MVAGPELITVKGDTSATGLEEGGRQSRCRRQAELTLKGIL